MEEQIRHLFDSYGVIQRVKLYKERVEGCGGGERLKGDALVVYTAKGGCGGTDGGGQIDPLVICSQVSLCCGYARVSILCCVATVDDNQPQ